MKDGSSGERYHDIKPEGGSSREAARDAENKSPWYQKIRGRIRSCARSSAKSILNPMFTTFIFLFIVIAFIIYWYYVRPNWKY